MVQYFGLVKLGGPSESSYNFQSKNSLILTLDNPADDQIQVSG